MTPAFLPPFYEITPAWNFESHTHTSDRWAPWKAANHSKEPCTGAAIAKVGVCRKFLGGAGINHYQLLFVQEQNKLNTVCLQSVLATREASARPSLYLKPQSSPGAQSPC